MLSVEDNELLTRTGRGTPMGELFRRFWIPALLSSELPQGGAPAVKVQLLGEKLIAFRGAGGRIGLLESRCPHRHANLYWGRNEDDGLRCVYHGWKFGFDGACMDMPAEPSDSAYKDRVKAVAYPTHEAGGIVWAYLGPAEHQPDFPDLEWTTLPEDHLYVTKRHQRCNYFQNVEGELDTAHVQFLHRELNKNHTFTPQKVFDEAENPEYTIAETPVGMLAIAQRALPDGNNYWRITPFCMPSFTTVPTAPGNRFTFTAAVPIDDTSMWGFTVTWAPRPLTDTELEQDRSGMRLHVLTEPDFTPVANMDNDYLRDFEAMATENFTGIMGIRSQDLPVQEDQDGPICERQGEHLGTTDRAIVAARRLMLRTAKALAKGVEPTQPTAAAAYRQRSFAGEGAGDVAWNVLFDQVQSEAAPVVHA
ncbi:Rieske 2Fe-2S domain-containing protein [Nocardioides sp. Iso805N]|uniref:Rieske 2Fe-2S domain-containing protein n=1 Tax=Nocardioides sp. Iso805N TaxID=1283287 RepID=UPI00039F9C3C|nr:Rieske 2Fe-2S domain-containing protein [Nocardioides sp. Iso805N]